MNIAMNLFKSIAPEIIEALFDSILSDNTRTAFKDSLVTFFRQTADKSVTEIDDYLVEMSIDMIMDPGKFCDDTRELCKILRSYVTENGTEWDDVVFLPIINRIEQFGVND